MFVKEVYSIGLTLSIDAIKIQDVICSDFSRSDSQVRLTNFRKSLNADLCLFKNKEMYPLSKLCYLQSFKYFSFFLILTCIYLFFACFSVPLMNDTKKISSL